MFGIVLEWKWVTVVEEVLLINLSFVSIMESSRSATMTTSKSTGWFAMSSDVVIVNVCDGLGGIQFNKCINMENKALLERCCEKERKKKK